MIKISKYLGGSLKSLGAEDQGQGFATGIVPTGTHSINTERNEHITVTVG